MTAIVIFAKYPEAGKVKTRLGAQIGLDLAAVFYKLFLRQTFEIAGAAKGHRVFVAFEPVDCAEAFRELTPVRFEIFPQSGADLGARLVHAFQTIFGLGADKVVAIGSDSPTLPPENLDLAFRKLDDHDLVLGPAEDGGYYLIGLNQPRRELFAGIEWSSDAVFASTIAAAANLKLDFESLPFWYDVDDVISLRRAAADDRSGRIAEILTRLSGAI